MSDLIGSSVAFGIKSENQGAAAGRVKNWIFLIFLG